MVQIQPRMAANQGKFQVMFMDLEKGQKSGLKISGISIRTTEEVKLLGTTIDSKLQFQSHVEATVFLRRQTKR